MNLFGPMLGYGVGFFPYVLGGLVAGKLTGLSYFSRLLVSASPTTIGGFLRFWVAHKTDIGQGKQAIMLLLKVGIAGFISLLYLIKKEDLSTVHSGDPLYYGILISNILSGAGIANYSASLPMSARSAPDDSTAVWLDRLMAIAESSPTYFEYIMSPLLRTGAAGYMAMVGGLGSLTPSVTLVIAAFLLPEIGLSNVYIMFGSIALAGTFSTNLLLRNSILDQLRDHGVSESIAKEIALWMGQKLQTNTQITYIQSIKNLNRRQIIALAVVCQSYVTTFGLLLAITSTASVTLSRRGLNTQTAVLYTAAISGLSSLFRALMVFPSLPFSHDTTTSAALAIMAISSLFFAISKEQSLWLPMLFLFAISNGIGNYAVFAQISDTLSDIVGLASGLAGGIGACTAIFISLALASLSSINKATRQSNSGLEQTDTALEYLLATGLSTVSLLINIIYSRTKQTEEKVISDTEINSIELTQNEKIKKKFPTYFYQRFHGNIRDASHPESSDGSQKLYTVL